jgi:hypothetical protein
MEVRLRRRHAPVSGLRHHGELGGARGCVVGDRSVAQVVEGPDVIGYLGLRERLPELTREPIVVDLRERKRNRDRARRAEIERVVDLRPAYLVVEKLDQVVEKLDHEVEEIALETDPAGS